MQMHFVKAVKRLRVKARLKPDDLILTPLIADVNPQLDDKALRS